VTPQTTSFLLSAELVIWAAVGGRFSPYGALAGAVGIGLLSATLRQHLPWWEVVVALVFIVVVLRFPGGLVGAWVGVMRRLGWPDDASAHVAWARAAGADPTAPAVHGLAASATSLVDGLAAKPLTSNGPSDAGLPVPLRPGVLQLRQVHVAQHGVGILNGLDLDVDAGGIHALIGPNGAGKTSTFNAMTGRLSVARGEILWEGQSLVGLTADAVARRGIGRKFQIPAVFPSLPVADHLRLALWATRVHWPDLLRMRTHARGSELLGHLVRQLPFLAERAAHPAGALSQGQRQMLELAMTVLPQPRLLLLDEPCAGLSPHETQQQTAMIADVVQRTGSTVLLIEHDMTAVQALARQVHVLHQGRRLASGSMEEVQANAAVREVYAGGHK
jgi:branched-chain amino acid transport system permease protein